MDNKGFTAAQIASHSPIKPSAEDESDLRLVQAWRDGYYDGLADAANSRITRKLIRRDNPYMKSRGSK